MATGFRLKSFTDEVLKDMDRAENRNRLAAGRHLQKQMKRRVSTKRVSQPGQAPGLVTGDLKKGIKVENQKRSRRTLVGVAAPASHAHLLEFGTAERVVKKTGRKVGKVEPRPFLAPTFEEESGKVREILNRTWV